MAKIDSIFDFTDKGLGELKAWLEPWFQRRSSCCDSSVAVPAYRECVLGNPHLFSYWPMDDASAGLVDIKRAANMVEVAPFGGYPTYAQPGPFHTEFPLRTSVLFGGATGGAGATERFEHSTSAPDLVPFSAYDWSIESWLYPAAITGAVANRIFDFQNDTGDGIAVDLGPSTQSVTGIAGNLGSTATVNSGVLPINTWVHWRLTYDGTTLRLYINGAAAASVALASGFTIASVWTVGNVSPSPAFVYGPFQGRISDFAIYDTALSTFCDTVTSTGPGFATATLGQVLTADGLGSTDWRALITVQTGPPSTYQTPLVFDDTAVTGGLYGWGGSAYQQIGPAI